MEYERKPSAVSVSLSPAQDAAQFLARKSDVQARNGHLEAHPASCNKGFGTRIRSVVSVEYPRDANTISSSSSALPAGQRGQDPLFSRIGCSIEKARGRPALFL